MGFEAEEDLSDFRLTLDYPEDLELVTSIFNALYKNNPLFSLSDIISYLRSQPKVRELNSKHLVPASPEAYWNTDAYIEEVHLDLAQILNKCNGLNRQKKYQSLLEHYEQVSEYVDRLKLRASHKLDP